MKKDYHPYVFDNNKFIGKFEEMYQNEKDSYDSWHQGDLRDYGYLTSFCILSHYNFNSIIDIGCGKGFFTSLLKKENNKVIGIDASKTAIAKAKASYPDIEFQCFPVHDCMDIQGIFHIYKSPVDLIMFKEVLSYIKNWKEILAVTKDFTKYIFVSLDLPPNPIGFVKTFKELEKAVKKDYKIIIQTTIKTSGNQMILLAEVKNGRK